MGAYARRATSTGAIFGLAITHLSLVGLVVALNDRELVAGVVSVGSTIAVIAALAAGFVASRPLRKGLAPPAPAVALGSGAIAGLVTGIIITALAWLVEAFTPRDVLINASPQLLPLLSGQQKAAEQGTPTQWYLYSKDKKRLAGPSETKEDILKQLGGEQPAGSKFYAVPQGKIVLTCTDTATVCPGVGVPAPGATYYYLFKYQPTNPTNPVPELTGNDLKGDQTRADFGQGNQPVVLLGFTNEGGDKFHTITRELSQRGLTQANLAGATGDDTFAHLRRSVELLPRFREDARRDDDFAAVRDDPRFEDALR